MSDLDEFTIESDPARLRIVGTWLVEESDECTGGACGLGYGHEPGCGQEPIVDLSTVPGWGDLVAPLIEARVREARADALTEAADEMEFIIANGDVAEVAAPVEGEVGRASAVSKRDRLYEEPVEWVRSSAEEVRRG